MGFYALRFCQERSLPTEGLGLTLEPIRAVKRHMMTPPEFRLHVVEAETAALV